MKNLIIFKEYKMRILFQVVTLLLVLGSVQLTVASAKAKCSDLKVLILDYENELHESANHFINLDNDLSDFNSQLPAYCEGGQGEMKSMFSHWIGVSDTESSKLRRIADRLGQYADCE